jgi:hypothetical protein
MVIVESIYRYLYVYFSCIDLIDLCLADIYIYGACLACLFLWIDESLANLSTWVKSLTRIYIYIYASKLKKYLETNIHMRKEKKKEGRIFWLKLWVKRFGWLLGNSSSCNEMFIDLIIRLHVFFKILYYNFDQLMILFNFNICNCEISKKWIYTILSNSFSRRISGAIYIIWYILWLWE